MAGDWIKWTKGLNRKKEVLCLSNLLNIPATHAAGLCMACWDWLDDHISEENIDETGAAHFDPRPLSHDFLDDIVQMPGFSKAMVAVGWMIKNPDGTVVFPNYARHNGKTAKERAMAALRMAKHRGRVVSTSDATSETRGACYGASVTEAQQKRNATVTREEKKREEKKRNPPIHPLPPLSPQETPQLRLPKGWECVRAEMEKWFRYLEKHGKYPIDLDLQAHEYCRMFSKPEDLAMVIKYAIANGFRTLSTDMLPRAIASQQSAVTSESLSDTVQRVMQKYQSQEDPNHA